MLSCGMFASFADSMAAFRRMLALGSPPPLRAATVISRRIFEKSLPRWTSVLPFLRLIWDHRECPDIVLPSFVVQHRLESLHPLEPPLPPRQRGLPSAPRARGGRSVRRTRPRFQIRPQVHVRQERGARVAGLAPPPPPPPHPHPPPQGRPAHAAEARPRTDDPR